MLGVEKAVTVVTAFCFPSLQELLHSSRRLSLKVLSFVHSFQVINRLSHPEVSRPMWSLTAALALAGRRPALRPRQRRLQPSQSATGGVGGPPARPQPPLQGRPTEGVERPGPSSPRHLGSAEGPVHIDPPPAPRSPFQKRDFRFSPEETPLTSSYLSTRKRSFCRLSVSTHRKHLVTGALAALGQTLPPRFLVCGSRRRHPSEWCYSRRGERRRR